MAGVSADRVERLLEAFGEHLGAGGALPRVDRDEAVAITTTMHAEIDRGVAIRAERTAQQGHAVACAKGCTSCCEQIVVVSEAEAITVARWLAEPAHAAPRTRFVARHAGWRRDGGDLVDAVASAAAREDMPALQRATGAAFARHLMCPFNHDGACDVYPVRPGVCREKEALDSAEPCRTGVGQATVATFVPVTRLMERINLLEGAMHASLPGAPRVRSPLADRVRTLLAQPAGAGATAVGRNEPCPCGSGKKYKRCCAA